MSRSSYRVRLMLSRWQAHNKPSVALSTSSNVATFNGWNHFLRVQVFKQNHWVIFFCCCKLLNSLSTSSRVATFNCYWKSVYHFSCVPVSNTLNIVHKFLRFFLELSMCSFFKHGFILLLKFSNWLCTSSNLAAIAFFADSRDERGQQKNKTAPNPSRSPCCVL